MTQDSGSPLNSRGTIAFEPAPPHTPSDTLLRVHRWDVAHASNLPDLTDPDVGSNVAAISPSGVIVVAEYSGIRVWEPDQPNQARLLEPDAPEKANRCCLQPRQQIPGHFRQLRPGSEHRLHPSYLEHRWQSSTSFLAESRPNLRLRISRLQPRRKATCLRRA